jgi:hypothetical protein
MKRVNWKSWWPIILVIPFTIGYLWYQGVHMDLKTITIASTCLIGAFVLLFVINKKSSE